MPTRGQGRDVDGAMDGALQFGGAQEALDFITQVRVRPLWQQNADSVAGLGGIDGKCGIDRLESAGDEVVVGDIVRRCAIDCLREIPADEESCLVRVNALSIAIHAACHTVHVGAIPDETALAVEDIGAEVDAVEAPGEDEAALVGDEGMDEGMHPRQADRLHSHPGVHPGVAVPFGEAVDRNAVRHGEFPADVELAIVDAGTVGRPIEAAAEAVPLGAIPTRDAVDDLAVGPFEIAEDDELIVENEHLMGVGKAIVGRQPSGDAAREGHPNAVHELGDAVDGIGAIPREVAADIKRVLE